MLNSIKINLFGLLQHIANSCHISAVAGIVFLHMFGPAFLSLASTGSFCFDKIIPAFVISSPKSGTKHLGFRSFQSQMLVPNTLNSPKYAVLDPLLSIYRPVPLFHLTTDLLLNLQVQNDRNIIFP